MEIMGLTKHGVEVKEDFGNKIIIKTFGVVDSARDLVANTLLKVDAERVQKRLRDFDIDYIVGENDFTILESTHEILSPEELKKIVNYLDKRLPSNIGGVASLPMLGGE